MADGNAIRRLLLILIDNAMKFTGSGGHVHIGLDRTNDTTIEVRDDGIGIPEQHIARVFDRFYQVDPSRSSGGSGLGLAIARWIAEEHGGRIDVTSTVGRGSIFRVFLPNT
jgi:signal transduction histidine kinase